MSKDREGKLRPPVVRWLVETGHEPIAETYVCGGTCDVVGIRWGERVGRRIPPIESLVAVELKLEDFAGVMRQAKNNAHIATESWIAMPVERVRRMRDDTIAKLHSEGIGMLAVDGGSVSVFASAARRVTEEKEWFEYRRKNWWRRRREFEHRLADELREAD